MIANQCSMVSNVCKPMLNWKGVAIDNTHVTLQTKMTEDNRWSLPTMSDIVHDTSPFMYFMNFSLFLTLVLQSSSHLGYNIIINIRSDSHVLRQNHQHPHSIVCQEGNAPNQLLLYYVPIFCH